MEKPFSFIECIMAERKEFIQTAGVQKTYALLYLTEGSFRLELEGKQMVLGKGDCAVFSDDIDFYRRVIDPISFLYLKFMPNPKCPFSVPIPLGKVRFRNRKRFQDSMAKCAALMDAVDPRVAYYREHLLEDALLQAFAEHYLTLDAEAPAPIRDNTVQQAGTFIRRNLSSKLSIDAICREAGTNPSTLNFKFRRELSRTVGEFVLEERMTLARTLLANTTYSVEKIAERCGFDNIYYFSNTFRKRQGMPPTEYRRQYH